MLCLRATTSWCRSTVTQICIPGPANTARESRKETLRQMADLSRRKLLSWTALAPLAGSTVAAAGTKGKASAQRSEPTVSDLARQRIQRLHLPNVPLLTHEGKRVMFYDDLIKDKAVSLNFFFAKCDEICPMVMANLAKVQKLLGADVGTKIFMYSFTLKPEED